MLTKEMLSTALEYIIEKYNEPATHVSLDLLTIRDQLEKLARSIPDESPLSDEQAFNFFEIIYQLNSDQYQGAEKHKNYYQHIVYTIFKGLIEDSSGVKRVGLVRTQFLSAIQKVMEKLSADNKKRVLLAVLMHPENALNIVCDELKTPEEASLTSPHSSSTSSSSNSVVAQPLEKVKISSGNFAFKKVTALFSSGGKKAEEAVSVEDSEDTSDLTDEETTLLPNKKC